MTTNNKNGKVISITVISVITFLLYLLYSSVSGFGLIGYSPIFIFVPIVIYTAMFFGGFCGFFFGLGVGFLLDCTAVSDPYFNSLVLMCIGLAAGIFSKIYINVNIFSAIFTGLIFSLIYSVLKFLASYLDTVKFEGLWFLFSHKVLLSTFYTTGFGIIVYVAIKMIKRRFCDHIKN